MWVQKNKPKESNEEICTGCRFISAYLSRNIWLRPPQKQQQQNKKTPLMEKYLKNVDYGTTVDETIHKLIYLHSEKEEGQRRLKTHTFTHTIHTPTLHSMQSCESKVHRGVGVNNSRERDVLDTVTQHCSPLNPAGSHIERHCSEAVSIIPPHLY